METRSPSAPASWRSSTSSATPRLDRPALPRPVRYAAPVHRRLPVPGRRREHQQGRREVHVPDQRRGAQAVRTACPTRPGSTPATARTPPSAPSARPSPNGAPAAGSSSPSPHTPIGDSRSCRTLCCRRTAAARRYLSVGRR
jgi:hypothetical protein